MERSTRPEARVALCYVRKSNVRKGKTADQVSPDRQRALIAALCKSRGWTSEFYADAQGHRSGRTEHREQWQALKARLHDPDVAALVAYDLSRLHRKGYRIGALIDECQQIGVAVVMAAPHQQLDFSAPTGKMIAAIIAMMDEMYAEDVSQRVIAATEHRKAQGKSIGRPPFGARRGSDGYLRPSTQGAWMLPGGTVVSGTADKPPAPGAVWRGYYDCARRLLELYAAGGHGWNRVAAALNDEGWWFRDDRGNPVPVTRSDVQRVIRQWPEYGGVVMERPSQSRRSTSEAPVLDARRAIFPLDLLYRVGDTLRRRALFPVPDRGRSITSYPYPLAGILYCAYCDAHPPHSARSSRASRGRLGGKGAGERNPVYRHRPDIQCGAARRSFSLSALHAAFAGLLDALAVEPASMHDLRQAAVQIGADAPGITPRAFEDERAAVIARCKRRIAAAVTLFADGRMDEADYRARIADNERQIADWQARRSAVGQVIVDVESTVEAVGNLRRLWDIATDEDRQALVRPLFDEVVVDLDRQEISGFRLKPWASTYLIARASLLDLPLQAEGTDGRLRQFSRPSVPSLEESVARILRLAQTHPISRTPYRARVEARNALIRATHAAGMRPSDLARLYDLSYERIRQILHRRHH